MDYEFIYQYREFNKHTKDNMLKLMICELISTTILFDISTARYTESSTVTTTVFIDSNILITNPNSNIQISNLINNNNNN